MKEYKYRKKILNLFIFVFAMFLFNLVNNIYAYQITYEAKIKEELPVSEGWPDLLYRKETAAYKSAIDKYDNALNGGGSLVLAADRWAYRSNNPSLNFNLNNAHSNENSFERYYEFFHKGINSYYTTPYNIGNDVDVSGLTTRYYLTGHTYITQDLPTDFEHYAAPVYNVWGETSEYRGVYDAPASTGNATNHLGNVSGTDTVVVPYNIYRYAIKDGIFVSDNILEGNVVEELIEKFPNNITERGLSVNVSSVLRTSYKNTSPYYNNMDTAFKFWETTIRGGRSWAWLESPTTTGTIGWGNNTAKPAESVINYYDNDLVVTENMLRNTKVYIRHINTTNLSAINYTTLQNASSLLITPSNGKAFVHTNNWEVFSSTKDRDTLDVTGYSEHYIKNLSTDFWRFANLKYNHQTAGSYWNLLNQTEQNTYANYTCVGAVVGKGDSLQQAVQNRNNKLSSITDLRSASSNNSAASSSAVEINGDYTSIVVQGDEQYDYVVIDFYYDKAPTKIYVRHLDVTNLTNTNNGSLYGDNDAAYRLTTSKGTAFITNKTFPYDRISDISRQNQNINPDPTRTVYTYQEIYSKPLKDYVRIANIKYDNSKAGSYWNKLTSTERNNTFKNYTCIGAVVGRGDTIDAAEVNRDRALSDSTFKGDVGQFIAKPSDYTEFAGDSTRYITKNGNYTHVLVDNNNSNCIVIDFYYKRPDEVQEDKYVYVRHIDITGKNNITSTVIDNLVSSGKVLNGKGVAVRKNGRSTYNVNKANIRVTGYQELYKITSGDTLTVSRDPNNEYICIGSNMIPNSSNSLPAAKTALDRKLNGSIKYDTGYTESRQTTYSKDDIVIIDFYYRSKHEGAPITREQVGRLAFYTVSTSNQFTNVNNWNSNNDATVVDAIPSGESLKMSVDNAYTYMLGAINIKEQKIKDTHTLNYTITQNYAITYKDWSSSCSGPCNGTYSDKKTGYCGRTYYVPCTHYSCSGEGESRKCGYEHIRDPKTCGGKWSATYTTETYNSSTTIKYTYQIPYEYTYYKVKNMRLYTISKIELIDTYSNYGLPLFEGQTYTTTPKQEYKTMFNNASFTQSKNSQSNTRSSSTMNNTLDYNYTHTYVSGTANNDNGDINTSDITKYGDKIVQDLYTNNIDHSEAAKMTGINKDGTPTGNNSIIVTFNVNNDKYAFEDTITTRSNDDIVIVGDSSKSVNNNKENSKYDDSYSRNEYNSVRKINLSNYTDGKTRSGTTSGFTYSTTEADRVSIKTQYPNATSSHYEPSTSPLTRDYYYNEKSLYIPKERVNGKRYSYGKIYYDLLTSNNKLNFDVSDSAAVDGNHTWNRTTVKGYGDGMTFADTEMHRNSRTTPQATTLINQYTLGSIVWEYGKNNKSNADVVNVFTPVAFTTSVKGSTSGQVVNHSNEALTNQIQKNAQFTIDIKTANHTKYSINTTKYLESYYIKFDFDVQDIFITDAIGRNRRYSSSIVSKGTWIGPIYNQRGTNKAANNQVSVSAYALADPNETLENSVVNQSQNSYTVRAIGYNAPSSLISDVASGRIRDKYVDNNQNTYVNDTTKYHYPDYYVQNNILSDSNFVAEAKEETENISRVYDFKVTDLKDIDWKDTFRKSTSTTTNVHTSKAYYSGINKWNIYTTASNDMVVRDASEIGVTKQQTLPLGPYKNTNTAYTKAPKLGYRFSFDLKTTGAFDKDVNGNIKVNKKIVIEPEFFYVSKKGEYIKDIELYYKNSNNKYVSIDNYNLYFVPDDGYRLTFEGTDAAYRFSNTSLSKSTVKLGTAKKITLTSKMMEQADKMFVQIWYGEYKLPNSTIAIKKNGGNINNPLKEGYIGVKFNITVYEYNNSDMTDGNLKRKIEYGKNNTNGNLPNSSQWDYEGYLGVKYNNSLSNANALRIALEDGTWIINNNTLYNDIKGTVILYDTDAKASSDYE